MIVFFALLAYAIAHFSSGIYSLLEAASSFGTSGLLIITFFGIYTRWGHALAGAMALVSGMIFYQVGDSWLAWDAPFLMAILAAFIAYVLGALIEQRWNFRSISPASP